MNNPDETRVVPFILQNLEEYKGATNGTTTGTYDNVDGSDMT